MKSFIRNYRAARCQYVGRWLYGNAVVCGRPGENQVVLLKFDDLVQKQRRCVSKGSRPFSRGGRPGSFGILATALKVTTKPISIRSKRGTNRGLKSGITAIRPAKRST